MKTLKNISKFIVLLLIALTTIYLCLRIYTLEKENNVQRKYIDELSNNQRTDTIYLDKVYTEPKVYSNTLNPELVTVTKLPKNHNHHVHVNGSKPSTVWFDSLKKGEGFKESISTDIEVHQSLSTNSGPSRDSLISFSFSVNRLTTTHILDTTVISKDFNIDVSRYQYLYMNGNLSYKKIPIKKRLDPYIELSYRPFNNMADLTGGIYFETSKFNYKLGLNMFYYPKLQNKIGSDVRLSITYKF